ncbi:MAG: ribonuclease HI family protein [Flammeovirgaceae bacterium]
MWCIDRDGIFKKGLEMTYFLFGDGGSRGNPGPAASGFAIFKAEKEPTGNLNYSADLEKLKQEVLALKSSGNLQKLLGKGVFLGNTTNNQAEWQSLIFGLQAIFDLGKVDLDEDSLFDEEVQVKADSKAVQVVVFLDSELVVKQSKGIYKVKNPDLKIHYLKLKELEKKFKKVAFIHIYREFNKEADGLVNETLDEQS